jgi:thiamine biosynthesis lipoprotein
VAALRTLGLTDFLLEVGGELRAAGCRPGGQAWQVLIDTGAGTTRRVALSDCAIATSGDRWQVREHRGRRWSHTLDPRTGKPVEHVLASVTVLAAECMDADALATVLTVLGPQAGLAFAEQHRIAALFAERATDGSLRLHASTVWPAGATAD